MAVQVTKLIDLLVALTISEEQMYPLIQTHVWAKIGREKDLLRRVLGSFIRMGITNGLGSRRVEVLADTVVTLEQGTEGLVATEVIKKLLKVSGGGGGRGKKGRGRELGRKRGGGEGREGGRERKSE